VREKHGKVEKKRHKKTGVTELRGKKRSALPSEVTLQKLETLVIKKKRVEGQMDKMPLKGKAGRRPLDKTGRKPEPHNG